MNNRFNLLYDTWFKVLSLFFACFFFHEQFSKNVQPIQKSWFIQYERRLPAVHHPIYY